VDIASTNLVASHCGGSYSGGFAAEAGRLGDPSLPIGFERRCRAKLPPQSQKSLQIYEESPGAPTPSLAAFIQLLLGLAIVVRFKFSFEFADDIPFTRL